ncbi:LuxR C-terminal-related transcriptional regulator [Streptomyces sp. NPDC101225]|uniref:helix-turn-helix transcriptional regulator n=1 Tax=Streptomyces sp. NPDC101225 TaxID=3366135 RepID=UPI00382A3C8F
MDILNERQRVPAGPGRGARSRLLERAAVLATVQAVALGAHRTHGTDGERAAHGGRGVLVLGPPGAGRTELLAEAARRARAAGLTVRTAQGRELERGTRLGLMSQMSDTPWPRAAPRPPEDRPGTRTLLVVDDVQWSDPASLRRLLALLDAGPAEVGLVAAVREGERSVAAPLVVRLTHHPRLLPLRLHPLSADAVAQLVVDTLPRAGERTAAAVARRTAGNPFLVRELLSALAVRPCSTAGAEADGVVPDAVRRAVALRTAVLPRAARRLAEAVAVLGDGAPLHDAAALAGLDPAVAAYAADTLAEARLLRRGGPLAFAEPLTGAAVYAQLPAFARSRAHRTAAGLLRSRRGSAEPIARHLLAAEPEGDPEAVAHLHEAATRARGLGDAPSATRLLRRALAEPPPADRRAILLLDLARAQLDCGDPAAYGSAVQSLSLLGGDQVTERAEALRTLARICQARGDLAQAAARIEEALALPGAASASHEDLLADYLTFALFHPPLRTPADLRLMPVLEAARQGRPPRRPGLLAHAALRLALAGDRPSLVRSLAERAVAEDPLVDTTDAGTLGTLLSFVVRSLVLVGEIDTGHAVADAALAAAARREGPLAHATAAYHRALCRYHQGLLADARTDLTPRAGVDAWDGAADWNAALIAQVQLEQGATDAARRVLRDARPTAADPMGAAMLLHARARLALADGDPATALASSREAGESLARVYAIDHPVLMPWRTTAALAAHRLGDRDQATALALRGLDRAQELGVPEAVGDALTVTGLVGNPRPDPGPLEEAARVLRDSQARLACAHALVEWGTALRRTGRRRASEPPLREGLALCTRLGARPLAERARRELHALGLRPRRTALFGIHALTPAEHRVALLAAAGGSNREVAQALFVTVKTVETHLGRVYRKLGVRGRGELAGAVRQEREETVPRPDTGPDRRAR